MEQAAGVRHLTTGTHVRGHGTGLPDRDQIRRRPARLVSPAVTRRSRSRLGSRWLAPGVWPSTRTRRARRPREGFDFLGFPCADSPASCSSSRARRRCRRDPRTARAPRCVPCEGRTPRRSRQRLNPIIRAGRPTPHGGVQQDVHQALDAYVWRLAFKWAERSQRSKPKRWWRPATSARSTAPGETAGCSATATAAPTSPSRLDQIIRHQPGQGPVVPHDPALIQYGLIGERTAPGGAGPAHLCQCSTGAVRSVGGSAARRPSATKPTRVGTVAGGHPQGGSQELPAVREGGTPGETRIVSSTPNANADTSATARAQHFCATL